MKAQNANATNARWTSTELKSIRAALEQEATRLRQDLDVAAHAYGTGVGEFFDGAGDEIGDVGSLMIELREGSTVASNESDILVQCERALERIGASTYGLCESCEKPITKARLRALPRATHCINCQQARMALS